jgi:hypothetical protein
MVPLLLRVFYSLASLESRLLIRYCLNSQFLRFEEEIMTGDSGVQVHNHNNRLSAHVFLHWGFWYERHKPDWLQWSWTVQLG